MHKHMHSHTVLSRRPLPALATGAALLMLSLLSLLVLAGCGATATAGGLVFTALQDGWIVAYNDETLEELWRFNVGTPLKGSPVTYAIGPKQFLAVQSSGRHVHPVKYDNLQSSSYLFVFALN